MNVNGDNYMKLRILLIVLGACMNMRAVAQDTLSVLFLGNSYTAANNLPQLVQSLSTSAGKTLIYDAAMPGGFTISGHMNDPTSLGKINQGTWDYIIVQEQSQVPTIDYYRYNHMYPALAQLKSLAQQANPCARLITYMTWGRRFGGQQCDPTNTYCSPVFVDFNHMQDSLTRTYTEISNNLNLQCSPVGVTWQNILNDTSLVLHSSDNSHPNLDGSYVAALSLFSCIWKQPSLGNTYHGGLASSRALYYQQQSDQTVWGRASEWNLTINEPEAVFSHTQVGNTFTFSNTSTPGAGGSGNLGHMWDFGDGQTSVVRDPMHTYTVPGSYTVRLIVSECIFSDTLTVTLNITATGIGQAESTSALAYPNPVEHELKIGRDERDLGKRFRVYGSLGNVCHEGIVSSVPTSVDTRHFPTGMYVLLVYGPSVTCARFIKKSTLSTQ